MKAYFLLCIALMGGAAWAQSQTCPTGMVYNECGSGCPASCTVPSPLCSSVCVPGCFCPAGKVLSGENTCVYPSDCPSAPTTATTGTPPTTSSAPPCAAGKVHESCGSACPTTCQNKDSPPQPCPAVCVPGCFCATGTILNTVDGSCVAEADCPASPSCAAGMVHQSCGSACPITCQNKDGPPQPCPLICVPGCFCATGTILNTVDGSCVAEADCPASNTTTATATTNPPTVAAPPVFELAYECPTTTLLGTCIIEETCSSSGTQNCGSPSQLCCTNGCGGKVCTEGVLPTPLCTAAREKALNKSQGLLGALIPQCEADGSFSEMQCFEGSCWCVNTTTGVSTSVLAAPGSLGSLDCAPTTATTGTTPTSTTAPDHCSLAPESGLCEAYMPHMFFNSTSGTCERFIYGGCGGNANRFTSFISCMEECGGVQVPYSAVQSTLSQTLVCPAVTPSNGLGTCENLCSSDANCSTSEKCCSNGCGNVCVSAISVPYYTAPQACPTSPFPICNLLGCQSHEACGDNNLCCPTGCGSICMTALTPAHHCPEAASYASSLNLIGSYIPQCNVDGTYRAKQSHGSTGMSWCVDTTTGQALTAPTSNASLDCSVSAPVCTNGQVFNQCGSECPLTCENKDNPPSCVDVCVTGCFCPAGTVLNGNTCVAPSECPFTPACTNGQAYSKCGSACPLTCENKDNPPSCIDECVTGCFCPAGTVLNGNTCVQPSECPITPACTNGQAYSKCGSACPLTCENKDNPPPCIDECVTGCFCPAGTVLNGNTCVQPSECPITPACTNGQAYSKCGSACPLTCENKDNPPPCIDECVTGCFCPAGTVLNGNTCVQPSECGPNCQGIQCDWPMCPNNAQPISDSKHCCPYCPSCTAGGLLLGEGQTYVDECTTCSCENGTILCNALVCPIPIIRTMRVGMKYDGDYDSIADMDGFKSDVKRTLVNNYDSLLESQITEVHVARGSVIITVVINDKTDRTGANVTLLIIQMEQDYKKGTLLMPLNDGTMRPTDKFEYGPHHAGLHAPLLFGIVGGIGFLLVVLIVVVLALLVIITVVIKKTSRRHTRLPPCSPEKLSGMKNPMFDLTEKA